MARPMLDVVAHVMDEPPAVTAYVDAGRRLHERVSRAVHAERRRGCSTDA